MMVRLTSSTAVVADFYGMQKSTISASQGSLAVTKEAIHIEDLGRRAARYRLSETWDGHLYVIVAPLVMPNGQSVMHVYAAKGTGPVTEVTSEGLPQLLLSLHGHLGHVEALDCAGWQVG